MSAPGAYRPRASACPGLFRVVPARDGGICRIKIPLGRLSKAQCHAVADVASRFGSGVIEITNRANLQIRGIAPSRVAAVAETLVGAELGPARTDSDDIRNVMVSPTAGIDPGRILDTQPLALALLDHVQEDEACRALSPKFSFLIDGGEDVAVLDHPHDIWMASVDGERMAIGFAGCPPVRADDSSAAGMIRPEDMPGVVTEAVAVFHEMAADDPAIMRLRHLFAAGSRDEFICRLGSRLERNAGIPAWRRRPARPRAVGIGRQCDGLSYIGAIPPLGRLTPEMLTGAAKISARYGVDVLRLTPWQGLLVPSIRDSNAAAAVASLEGLGFVCDAGTPLASMIACVGAPGCSAGFADTKADALALASRLSGGARTIHLSGCEKSCAVAGVADKTLVAVAPGVYDVYARDDVRTASRFGRSLAKAATLEQAEQYLRNDR